LVDGEREEEELFDLSAGIAWFGDIIKIGGVLVEIGARSVFGNPTVGDRDASGGGFAHDLTPLVPAAWGVGREARG
jgi:hypothetical protein